MHFIVANAAKHDVDDTSLVQEIQQLGLPKENSDVICKLYREKKDEMREVFANESYSIAKILKTDWRIDTVVASSEGPETPVHAVAHIKMTMDARPQDKIVKEDDADEVTADGHKVKELAFEISTEKLNVLVHELTRAKNVLDGLEG